MKVNPIPVAARRPCSYVLLAAALTLPFCAAAMDRPTYGFNIGGGAGSNSVDGADYTGNGNRVDDRQVAYKGMVGLRLNPAVSLEAQYLDFGTAKDGDNRVKARGVTAGGVFEARMSRHVHPYAKAGVLFWDADGQFSGVARSDDGTDFAYGGGLRFLLGRAVDIRTEYERFEFNTTDVHTISAMLQFNF